MKLRDLLIACICSLVFADNDMNNNDEYWFRRFLQFSSNSICRNDNDICRSKKEVRRYVLEGLVVALRECQSQFKNRRWNCSDGSIERIMRYDFRESAFLSAINAAGVTFVVAHACSSGDLHLCDCEQFKHRTKKMVQQQLAERFAKRGACNKNIDFAEDISRTVFTDKNAVVDARTELTRWNYEAGREALRSLMKKNCKCFGYSGQCTQKACWLQLPSFSRIGTVLKERFDSASKVSFGNKGKTFHPYHEAMKPPTKHDLVYTMDAPSFCEPDPDVGSVGTKGRYCSDTSMGTEGCDIMCCGRGSKRGVERTAFLCNCTIIRCCRVACDTCYRQKTVHVCR